MTLDEYRTEIEKGERGEFQDAPGHKGATATAFRLLAKELREACWQPGFREEAASLAARAAALGRA